jgi:twitching motility protein PilT
MLAESMIGIVAQQLVKTADGKGRVAAQEILLGSHAVAAMIRENKTFQLTSLMQSGKGQGMQTMDLCLERLVRAGTITPAAGVEKAEDKESFRKLFNVGGAQGEAPPA